MAWVNQSSPEGCDSDHGAIHRGHENALSRRGSQIYWTTYPRLASSPWA